MLGAYPDGVVLIAPSGNEDWPASAGDDTDAGGLAASARVLTLNAHQGFGALRRSSLLAGIRDGLRATSADLVFLQEVGGDDRAVHQYEVLADQVWPQHAYGRNAVSEAGHQGNALLSKYPIVSWRNVDVSVSGVEPRGLLHCVLQLPDGTLMHAICVHFGLRETHRKHQAERLLHLIRTEVPAQAPLVVAGDFNDWRSSIHRRLQSDHLVEVFAAAGQRPARTFPARWPLLRLDRIYVRNLRHRPLTLHRNPWSRLSDHVPLAAEIAWRTG